MKDETTNNVDKVIKNLALIDGLIDLLNERINYLDQYEKYESNMTWETYDELNKAQTEVIDAIIHFLDFLYKQTDMLDELIDNLEKNKSSLTKEAYEMTWESYQKLYDELLDYQMELGNKQFELSSKQMETSMDMLEFMNISEENMMLQTREFPTSAIKKGVAWVWENKDEIIELIKIIKNNIRSKR